MTNITHTFIESEINEFTKTILSYDDVISDTNLPEPPSVNFSGYPSIIIYLSVYEDFSRVNLSDTIHHYVDELMQKLIELKKSDSSLCYGITGVAYAIRFAASKKNRYISLQKKVDNLFIKITNEALNEIRKKFANGNLEESDYDVIQGLSSNLIYLLDIDESKEKKQLITELLNYFIELTSNNKEMIPNFAIKRKNMPNEYLKSEFNEGYLNWSVSHGIAGPLLAMSLSYRKGYRLINLEENIKHLLLNYRNISEEIESKIFWEGRTSIDQSFNSFSNSDGGFQRASWCYGTPGIARVLYISSDIVGDNDTKNFSLNTLKELCQMSLSKLLLDSPTICHGLAGVLMIVDTMYKETNDIIFKNYSDELIKEIFKHKQAEYQFSFYDYDYKNFNNNPEKKEFIEDLSILSGATGVFLSIMSTIMKNDLNWKSIFFV